MRRHILGFARSVRGMDWFDWFYMSFIVFASALFCAVVDELWEAFNP